MLSGLQQSVITLLIMHLKQQQANRNEVAMMKIYRKANVWNILYVFLQL